MCIACIYLDDMQAHRFKKYQSYIYPQKGKFKIEIIAFNKKNRTETNRNKIQIIVN